jgi:hypothetical protein
MLSRRLRVLTPQMIPVFIKLIGGFSGSGFGDLGGFRAQ